MGDFYIFGSTSTIMERVNLDLYDIEFITFIDNLDTQK